MDANSLPEFKILPYESDLEYDSYDEKPLPNPISLKTSSSWTYCGPLLSLDPNNLPSSFETWANTTITGSLTGPLLSFLNFVHDFLSSNNISHYWLTIRAEKGSNKFNTPRWHTDDLFFCPPTNTHRRRSSLNLNILNSISRIQGIPRRKSEDLNVPDFPPSPAQITASVSNPTNWKLTTTLLGPGTLFITQDSTPLARDIQRNVKRDIRVQSPDHFCASVRCAGCAEAAEEVRERLAAQLAAYKTVQVQPGECAFFRVGEDEGAVHSEPLSNGDRIFVNVVTGNEADLKSLMAKWGMDYPRAWCVGLPLQMSEVNWKNVDGF